MLQNFISNYVNKILKPFTEDKKPDYHVIIGACQ